MIFGLMSIFGLVFGPVASIAAENTVVWDPNTLVKLQAAGLELGSLLPGFPTSGPTAELIKNKVYSSIVESIARDLAALKKADARLSTTMSTSHRLFDISWLNAKSATFELAAIVNRLDRAPFESNSCGELRLIYRLTYDLKDKGHTIHSRLPFTVNMVFHQPKGQENFCAGYVAKWNSFLSAIATENSGKATALLHESLTHLKSIETNMQSVRWPSTTRGDLGAHAEYLLRVFRVKSGKAELTPLENTPAYERIAKNPLQKKALLLWIKENLSNINDGIAIAPEQFLISKATSFSPRGLTRIANRPWSAIFSATDFKDLDYQALSYIKSPAALLRRLDDSSCTGCHQNRSVAGFHILGVDRPGTSPFNAIAVPGSPHFINDLPRRSAFYQDMKAKKTPADFRPLSERSTDEDGSFGAHCGLGDPGFKDWTCGKNLVCKSYGLEKSDNTVGQCFSSGIYAEVGEPCETGQMLPNIDPHKDRVKQTQSLTCQSEGYCESNYVGFPEGMCAQSCASQSPDSTIMTCGAIAILAGFNSCLGKGLPFTKCLDENTRPAGLRSCSIESPCRDDFLCSGLFGKTGTCIPPYFLFQMRVDGHPKPR